MDYANLKIPNHVAIILDGNGRWAKEHNLIRSLGHKAGYENLKDLSLYIFSQGIKYLSVYAFSTENFKRSEEEVSYLMNLFIEKFNQEFDIYRKENVKVVFSGRRQGLNDDVLTAMDKIELKTKDNTRGLFNICLNYGGQFELIDAVKKLVAANVEIDRLTPETFSHYLYQDLPPVDLMIRTSGEARLSNFMPWQLSYAEFYFSNIYFPAFNHEAFDNAIIEYTSRDRRFGGVINENTSN